MAMTVAIVSVTVRGVKPAKKMKLTVVANKNNKTKPHNH